MGRRHLTRTAALAALAGLALVAPASASLRWTLVAHGVAGGGPVSQVAYVAVDRPGTKSFASRLGATGVAAVGKVDFARDVAVAVFGPYGCQDGLIDVTALVQHGKTLAVALRERAPTPGTAECMAIFETYRVLTVPKASLRKPYPTRATVTLARA